jgi:hypothetical protein
MSLPGEGTLTGEELWPCPEAGWYEEAGGTLGSTWHVPHRGDSFAVVTSGEQHSHRKAA